MRYPVLVYPLLFVGAGPCIGGCGSAAKPAVPSRGSSLPVREPVREVDAGTVARVVPPGPIAVAPLERVSLTRFESVAKACAGIVAHSASPVLRNERGWTFTSVRTACRERPANPSAPADSHRASGEPSLVEASRTTAFPRHDDVESVAAALAFPVGNADWLVAIDGVEESEGMQSMSHGDASGSVEVESVDRVDLVGTEAPELVFVLAVAQNGGERKDFVVCDSGGAWCTKPSTLDLLSARRGHPRVTPDGPPRANEARRYTFRRHPQGLLVKTTEEPQARERLFPLAATP